MLPLLSRHNDKKNFLAWLNEEDHCRIMAMEKGGDMKGVFERFARGLLVSLYTFVLFV